jgi:hypothetical protein
MKLTGDAQEDILLKRNEGKLSWDPVSIEALTIKQSHPS